MGEIAAIITAICWALTSIFFTISGRQVGSVVVNRIRLLFAVAMLLVVHFFVLGELIPIQAGIDRWFWLGLSGIVGLVLGDAFLFQAYVMIGARISTLMMAIVPVISALMAWVFLNESLTWIEILGIALTVAGIIWVVLESKNNGEAHADKRKYLIGLIFAFGGALGQATGLILAKKGLEGDFSSLSAVLLRMLIAMSTLWVVTILSGQARPTLRVFTDRRLMRIIALGSLIGPVIGVWLSLVAIQESYVGVASTLMALTPIAVLPFVRLVFKEEVSKRAILGTLVAMAGVAVLFLPA